MIENAPQVLLALPSEEAAKSIAAQLRRCDMSCRIVTSMEELSSAIATQTISLALVGMRFDGKCGLEFCRRKRELLRHVLLVMVAEDSNPSTESVVSVMKAGAEDVLVPPYDPVQIRQLVSLGQRRFAHQAASSNHSECEVWDEDEVPERRLGELAAEKEMQDGASTHPTAAPAGKSVSTIQSGRDGKPPSQHRDSGRMPQEQAQVERQPASSDVNGRASNHFRSSQPSRLPGGKMPSNLRGHGNPNREVSIDQAKSTEQRAGHPAGSSREVRAHSNHGGNRAGQLGHPNDRLGDAENLSASQLQRIANEDDTKAPRSPRLLKAQSAAVASEGRGPSRRGRASASTRTEAMDDGPSIGMRRDEQLAILESMLIGRSHALEQVRQAIVDVADTTAAVMITGESGTGKELVAHAIHRLSLRAEGPFVPVNMAAIPQGLAESLLFGHEKGAFTNAVASQTGWCESADQGTLFLDEIGEMEMALQPKLLRFLQEGTLHPVGARLPKRVDVRIITATNRSPERIVRERILREDLYFRLHVVPIHLPPLRERREDIGPLANLFLQRAAERHRRSVECFSQGALAELEAATWPGNIRQLENLVERMVIFARHAEIQPSDFPMDFHAMTSRVASDRMDEFGSSHSLADAIDPFDDGLESLTLMESKERDAILQALERCGGHVVAAAGILGIGQATLYRKLKRYRIDRKKLQAKTTLR